MKVILIGLDGVAFDLLEEPLGKGKMPNLKDMITNGSHSKLSSTTPPDSAPSWPSMITGCNAAKHGIFDFTEKRGYKLVPRKPQFPKGLPLWDILSENDKKVGFINVPVTYPPQPTSGFIISGFPVPEGANFTFPQELEKEIDKVSDGYLIEIDMREDDDAVLAQLYEEAEKRTKVTLHMMQKHPTDFLMVVYTGTDRMQHDFWKYFDKKSKLYSSDKSTEMRNKITKYLEYVDDCVGQIKSNASEDTIIMIVSDHGSGPLYRYINVNNFLLKNGYLCLKNRPATHFKKFLYNMGIMPMNAYSFAKKLGIKKIRQKSNEESITTRIMKKTFLTSYDVDWKKTSAFYVGVVGWGPIYLNVANREPDGIVSLGNQYEEIRDKIIADLKKLEYDGRKLVVDVWKREEVYAGPYLDKAPDIIFQPIDGYSCFYAHDFASLGITMPPFGISGDHRYDGILIASGPGIIKGELPNKPNVIDIAPTVLHMLGVGIPQYMDGKPIMELFDINSNLSRQPLMVDSSAQTSKTEDEVWTTEQNEEIEERLRSMGYLG
jgi:predicted AlkP superfamily phosphohydrolase/phosphomutase